MHPPSNMLVLMLTSFFLGGSAIEPCVPYISEISNLTFGNYRDLQFIELQVAESCRANRKAMQEMIFSDYGLVILHTKSREKGNRLAFEMKTFVKFARSVWPKQRHEANAKRGGRRVADEFLAFFVVGGPASLAPPVTASDRSGEAINWDMYTTDIGGKCGSLINWPNCEQAMPQGQGSLDRFLVTEAPSPVFVHVVSEKEVLRGQTVLILVKFDHKKRKEEADYFSRAFSYVQFDSNKNKYFAPELVVTREKQEWLSAHAKDIVVLTPSLDESEILPLHRLKYLISSHLPVAIHVLPEGFTGLRGDESISRCSPDEHIFAITKRTPGSDNLCDFNVDYLHRTPITELCEPDETPEDNTNASEDMILDTEEFYEPYLDILMDVDDVTPSTSQQPTPAPATPAHTTLIPAAPAPVTAAPHRGSCPNLELIRKQDKAIISLNRILQGEERIQNQVCNVDSRVRQIQSNLNEQEELRKAAAEYATLEVKKKFGKERDPELHDKLRRLRQIGIDFTDNQIKKMSHSWLQLVLDDSDLTNSFFRCKLCNREHPLTNQASLFEHCSRATYDAGKRTNLMGANQVLCIKQMADASRGWKHNLFRAIANHVNTKEHMHGEKMYHQACGAQRQENLKLAVQATMTATLSAYTIAKQGLPLSTQFPLLMFALRSGASVGSAHYEATTAKRMIKNFAVHIEYELFKYLTTNDLPFSILMDGSSSSRGTKWMCYMIRTLTPSFKPYTFHLLIAELRRETGESITDTLLSHLKELSSWKESPGLSTSPYDHAMERLVAVTTDGASTMTGHIDGVYGRLRSHIKEQTERSSLPRHDLLLSVCAAHKLNLAMKDARHPGYRLARALIMEMHRIFGATQSSSARRHYKDVAKLMSFVNLEMGQFFAIRWTDSFRKGLSNVARMWPVLIESLHRVAEDSTITENTRTRARLASWIMRDGRVFFMVEYVLRALDTIASLSLTFQNSDSLAVDAMESGRAAQRKLIDESVTDSVSNRVVKELTRYRSVVYLFDGKHQKRLDREFLKKYHSHSEDSLREAETSQQSKNWQLIYLPTHFKDYKPRNDDDLTDEEKALRSALISQKSFRLLEERTNDDDFFENVDPESESLYFGQEDSPDMVHESGLNFGLGSSYRSFLSILGDKSVWDEAQAMLTDTYASIGNRMQSSSIPDHMFVAVDRHIILDIIDFEGQFPTAWEKYAPPTATFENRGFAHYIGFGDVYDIATRNKMFTESIGWLEHYCVSSGLKEPLYTFYSSLHNRVHDLREWPQNLREDKTSGRLYEKLLEFRDELDMPPEVELVFKCVLVIPASNADSERTFSTANRLTAGERNSLSTKTINAVMHVQQNGPNLLTVSPKKLAYQWTNPKPGLHLPRGIHSSKGSTMNMMSTIQKAYFKKNWDADSFHEVLGSEVDVDGLLHVFAEQALKKSLHSKSDVNLIRQEILAEEKAKSEIFSIGLAHVDDSDDL